MTNRVISGVLRSNTIKQEAKCGCRCIPGAIAVGRVFAELACHFDPCPNQKCLVRSDKRVNIIQHLHVIVTRCLYRAGINGRDRSSVVLPGGACNLRENLTTSVDEIVPERLNGGVGHGRRRVDQAGPGIENVAHRIRWSVQVRLPRPPFKKCWFQTHTSK